MTPAELKKRVYDILDDRIRPRIDQKTLTGDASATIQHAVNLVLGNIAVLATNDSREVAIDYLYDLQRKLLKGVTREMVRTNAYQCFGHFRTEILAFREMHKLLDEDVHCETILQRVQHILDTEAKEFDVEPGAEPTPSIHELMGDCEPDDEASFIKRMSEYSNAKNKKRKA
jgi:hypothetical protein